jgi:hypothetical protein
MTRGAERRAPIRIGVLALGLVFAASLTGSTRAATGSDAGAEQQLSNERTLTHWAHPAERAPIRVRHAADARRIVSTHPLTEDGFPEVYLVLASWQDRSGRVWLEVRIPMRPNGQRGWVRERALGDLHRVSTRLVVDRSSRQATLYREGRKIWSEPVGVGAPATPTPAGSFWIREKFKTGDPSGPFGPAALGTSAYSVLSDWPGGGVVGIHGTDQPSLIPGRPSHGCIRVKNGPLRELFHRLPIGTPVLIR